MSPFGAKCATRNGALFSRIRISGGSATRGGSGESRSASHLRGPRNKQESDCGTVCGRVAAFGLCFPFAGTGLVNRGGPEEILRNGKPPRHRLRQCGRRFQQGRSAPFACRGGGSPLGQQLTNFFRGHGATGFGVANALVDGGESLLVFIV